MDGWENTGEKDGVCLWRRRNRWLCLPPGQQPEVESVDYASQMAALVAAPRPIPKGVRPTFEERMGWGVCFNFKNRSGNCR